MAKMEYMRDGEKYEYDTEIRDDHVVGHPVRMTSYHSVIDPTWSVNYILDVQEAEREAGREICGAPKNDGFPCKKYPITNDEELFPNEIGRCELHRSSMNRDTDLIVSEAAIIERMPTRIGSPTARRIMNIADNLFLGCGNCNIRERCSRVGENNGRCIIEKEMFESMLSELNTEGVLETFADQAIAISTADTLIKMIRTSIHEAHYGLTESLARGTAQYNTKLKELLYKGLKLLGVDRKTRITVKHKNGRIQTFGGSIAKALSGVDIKEIEVAAARYKVEKRERKRTGPPVGIDGKVIKDDVPFEKEA